MFVDDKAKGESQKIEPSFESFLAFAEKQPVDVAYEYICMTSCACYQFAVSIGRLDDWDNNSFLSSIWDDFNYIAYHKPHTFGALSERLRLKKKYL